MFQLLLLTLAALTGCVDDTTDGNGGSDSGSSGAADVDGDGYDDEAEGGTDCNDSDAAIHPGADEVCNGIDDDCNGSVDDQASDMQTWYGDSDGDGVGRGSGTRSCDPGDGSVTTGGDCDDEDASRTPGAPEQCDGIDNDCDEVVPADEADADDDGWVPCEGWVGDAAIDGGGDCDDTLVHVHPGAVERCDGLDTDCDGAVPADETDDDGDGYRECDGGDCDDTDDTVFDGATEVCDDGADNDCDTSFDCDDADCSDSAACVETDCTDGKDDDGDGLIDCEDADCAFDASCGEDCTNGEDDDGDGLIDCVDSDCYGAEACPVSAIVHVDSGRFNATVFSPDLFGIGRATASGVAGEVDVVSSGGSWVSCGWSVRAAAMYGVFDSSLGAFDFTVSRKGTSVESGCGFTAVGSFLPSALRVYWGSSVWRLTESTAADTSAPFPTWYDPSWASFRVSFGSSYMVAGGALESHSFTR